MKAADFVGLLFLGRDVAHSVHLNTRSFAKHMALQTFYEEIVELADSFAEAYQGKYGLIGGITLQSAKKTANIVEFLQEQMDEIEANRYKVVDKDCTALHNIIDEIVGLYLSTLYKLRFLA
jgi:DNA-binding ferritin-like protein